MTKSAIKERGETALENIGSPEANIAPGSRWKVPGYVLRYRNSDLKRIEASRKDAGVDSFFRELAERCTAGTVDMELLDLYLEHGVKKDGQPAALDNDQLDDIPVHDLWEVIFEAVVRSQRGMSAREYLDELAEAARQAFGQLDPSRQSPETGLTNSVEPPSGQE